jgi:hypothetical protein
MSNRDGEREDPIIADLLADMVALTKKPVSTMPTTKPIQEPTL